MPWTPSNFNEAASRGQRIRARSPRPHRRSHRHFNEAASRGQRIPRHLRPVVERAVPASMRPPAVASGYRMDSALQMLVDGASMRPPAVASGYRRVVDVALVDEGGASMRPPAVASGYTSPARAISARTRCFNEAASRGQRIRTNRKYPTRQRLRIVLRALPHHDHTRAARLSPARCGRCHHLSARTSSARAALQGRLAPGRAPARPWCRFTLLPAGLRVRVLRGSVGRPVASMELRCACGARRR